MALVGGHTRVIEQFSNSSVGSDKGGRVVEQLAVNELVRILILQMLGAQTGRSTARMIGGNEVYRILAPCHAVLALHGTQSKL